MGVRVKLRVSSDIGEIEASALLNTGFEGEGPEVLFPLRAAELLGLWPSLPKGAEIRGFETPGGVVRMYYLRQAVKARAITEDRESNAVECSAIISEIEREILLNDKAIDEFGFIIESPGKGLWRFRGEGKDRESEAPQYW
jgi:hypothetical protein